MSERAHPTLGEPIAEPVPIKIAAMTWVNGLALLFGAIALIVALVMILDDSDLVGAAGVVAGVGLALLGFGGVEAFRRRSHRRYFYVYEGGVRVKDKGRQMVLPWEQIRGLGFNRQERLNNGEYAGMEFALRFWKSEAFDRKPNLDLGCYFRKDDGDVDLFAHAMDVLVERVVAQMKTAVAGGAKVPGRGFVLDANGLRVGTRTLTLDELASYGVYSKKLSLWRRDEAEPCLTIPMEGANVLPLVRYLDEVFAERPGERPEVPGLGRVLFERKSSKVAAVVLWVLAPGIGMIALVLALGVTFGGEPWIGLGVGVLGVVVAGLMFLGGVHQWRASFRCHEKGVVQVNLFSSSELYYEDVEQFTYQATRQYYNGAYIGTSLVVRFVPPKPAKQLAYSTTVRGSDDDLDELREHISGVVGRHLLERLADGGEVPWTGDVVFTQTGLRYRRRKTFGKGEVRELPYDRIQGFTMQDGAFHLFEQGEERSVIDLATGTPNFFPGFYALGDIVAPPEEAAGGFPAEPNAEGPPAADEPA